MRHAWFSGVWAPPTASNTTLQSLPSVQRSMTATASSASTLMVMQSTARAATSSAASGLPSTAMRAPAAAATWAMVNPHRPAADHCHVIAGRYRRHAAGMHRYRVHFDQRSGVEADGVRQPVHHLLRRRQQLREAPRPARAADVDQPGGAQVVVAAETLGAVVAGDGRLAHHALAGGEAGHPGADRAHHAGQLVTGDVRRPRRRPRTVVAVQVAAADPGGVGSDQHLTGAGLRVGHRLHADVAAAIEQSCLHGRQW